MRKVPTLFKRGPEGMRRVLPEVTPGCEWVLAGEGVPTRKYDGTCVMLDKRARLGARTLDLRQRRKDALDRPATSRHQAALYGLKPGK